MKTFIICSIAISSLLTVMTSIDLVFPSGLEISRLERDRMLVTCLIYLLWMVGSLTTYLWECRKPVPAVDSLPKDREFVDRS